MANEIFTGEKSKLSAAAWRNFLILVENADPVIAEEIDLITYAVEQVPGDLVRDHAFFEIGFRFALHCLEQGNLKIVGNSN
jgi:hypothetical protein